MPDASFYIWSKVPGGLSSQDFVTKLLKQTGVVTTPGNGFARRARAISASRSLLSGSTEGGCVTDFPTLDAYVSMGSNQGDPEANIEEALHRLEHYGSDLRLDAQSPLYRTEPQDVRDQPWFVNSVVRFKVGSDIWAPEGLCPRWQGR